MRKTQPRARENWIKKVGLFISVDFFYRRRRRADVFAWSASGLVLLLVLWYWCPLRANICTVRWCAFWPSPASATVSFTVAHCTDTLFFVFFFISYLNSLKPSSSSVDSLLQVDRGPFPYWLGLLLLLLLSFKVLDSLACVCKSGFHSLSLNFSVFSLPLGARAEEEQYWDQKSIWKIKKTKVFQVFGFRVCLVSSCCCWSTTRHDTRVVVWPLSSLDE